MDLVSRFFLITMMCFGTAAANAADCISRAEMQDIASHFTQFKSLANQDFCYDGSQTSNLLMSLMFMRKTEFSADMKPSTDELFSGRFANSWYQYFIQRIGDINVQSSCPKGVGAYVYGFGDTMYVCPMMLTQNFSALDRASVFMHEARHMDGYPHITCKQGPRKGLQGACDSRIADGGSYAVTVETYAQIAKYAQNLHPALKAYSMVSAATYADETFDTPARVSKAPELLVMSRAQDFYSLNLENRQASTTLGKSPALGHIVMRAQHMILFPDDKTLPARYVFAKNEGEIQQSAGDASLEYNSQTPEQRAQWVDLYIGAQWTAKVYTQKIKFTCDPKSDSASEISLPSGEQSSGILHLAGYNRAALSSFLATSSGKILEFGCQSLKPFLRASSVQLDRTFKRIHKVGNRLVGLSEGSLYELSSNGSQLIRSNLDGQIHEIAPRNRYEFLEVR